MVGGVGKMPTKKFSIARRKALPGIVAEVDAV